jgi:hypothetical protein
VLAGATPDLVHNTCGEGFVGRLKRFLGRGSSSPVPAARATPAISAAQADLPEIANLHGPFHRLASPTQMDLVRNAIMDSGELWGTYPRTGGEPAAQAHVGPLPENAGPGSLEFYTTVQPSALSTRTGYASWEAGRAEGVGEFTFNGTEWASIPIIVTEAR